MSLPINQVICGDSFQILKTFPEKSVDLIVTDPPYGIDYLSNHYIQGNPYENIIGDKKADLFIVPQLFRVLKDGGALYLFCHITNYEDWKVAIKRSGFRWKNTIVWVKDNWTAGDLTGDFGRQYELIIFAVKETWHMHDLRGPRLSNVWYAKRILPTRHPTEKPVELALKCIQSSSNKGDIVLDPFAGSGTFCIASKYLNRSYIGIDIKLEYCEIARKRLNGISGGLIQT